MLITFLTILVLVFIIGVINYNNKSNQFITFAENPNNNLVLRLKTNDIPYIIDEEGKLKIKKKYEKKALACCT